nr:immunoglobulin light chain junction region [Macaca mulatta]
CCQHSRGYTF